MSFQAMAWAVDQDCGNAGQKLILLMLANHTNQHTERCDPSHKRLAEECSMGVSTLKRCIQALADAGFIEIIPRYSDGVNLPNQYRLKMEGVGPQRAGGGSKSGRGSAQIGLGVGPNRATKQEINLEGNQEGNRLPAPADAGATREVWDAYATAYRNHYGVEPVRNAKVNGQIKQLVARIGSDAAHVAAHFVRSPNAFYAQRGHAIGALLADAEKVRTEWATGRQVTVSEARMNDRTAGNGFAALLQQMDQHGERM